MMPWYSGSLAASTQNKVGRVQIRPEQHTGGSRWRVSTHRWMALKNNHFYFYQKEGWVGWPLLQNLYCSDKARTSGRMDYLNGMGLLGGNKEGIEISLVSNTKYALVSNMKNRCFGVQYEMHQIHFDGRWEAITDQSIANQFKCFCHFNFVQI